MCDIESVGPWWKYGLVQYHSVTELGTGRTLDVGKICNKIKTERVIVTCLNFFSDRPYCKLLTIFVPLNSFKNRIRMP